MMFGQSLVTRLHAFYRQHSDFVLILILFVTFRMLALAAFRPGGMVLDFSDFLWYRNFGELTRQGYVPYSNMWETYPPLFSIIMVFFYQISTLLPPWEHANLWYTLLLGAFFLFFETANFTLLYLLARKLFSHTSADQSAELSQNGLSIPPAVLRSCWIYAAFFVPVYTVTGWFESYPFFFFLLSLYLLLENRPYLSAFFTGIGFMIKLIPFILLPVAVQLFSQVKYSLEFKDKKLAFTRLSARQTDEAILPHSSVIIPFDISRTLLYVFVFIVTVILIGLPFYLMNPALIFGPQLIAGTRLPWETVWALVDGNYAYGTIPFDLRDLSWRPSAAPPTRIPWLAVTGIFAVVYGLFYTRPFGWRQPRKSLAFVGFTLCLFMLWSKGYSPQWLNWPLFFIALLLPNLRGITYATILSLGNIIEANFFFIIFPEDYWLLASTVLIRTFLLVVLAGEFLLLIWPHVVTAKVARLRAWGLAIFVLFLLVGTIPAGWQLGRSYFAHRQQQSPYSATISRLQEETVTGALLLNNHRAYDWLYPYLRHDYTFFMLDEYAPANSSVESRTRHLLDTIQAETDVLWIYDADAATTTPAEEIVSRWLEGRPPAHIQDIDGGRLYLFILQ